MSADLDKPKRKGFFKKRLKLAKFAKALIGGKNHREAALAAGYKGSGISVRATALSKEPEVIRALDAALDRAGASLDKTARVIAEAHRANTVKVFNDPENGITYSDPLIDHNTRMKAAELNLKARGLLQSHDDGSGQVIGVGFFLLKGLKDRGMTAPTIEAQAE